jgi:hypothetical protein
MDPEVLRCVLPLGLGVITAGLSFLAGRQNGKELMKKGNEDALERLNSKIFKYIGIGVLGIGASVIVGMEGRDLFLSALSSLPLDAQFKIYSAYDAIVTGLFNITSLGIVGLSSFIVGLNKAALNTVNTDSSKK